MAMEKEPKNNQEPQEKNKSASKVRLREILGVLGRHDIVHGMTPQKLRMIMEDLGPTYIKLGQIMSMRSDILPQTYCDELTRLRTNVKPMEFETILQIVEQEYHVPPKSIFSSIDPVPYGSASIAQVHAAELKEGGKVVIKVQRPGIYQIMAEDIQLLRKAVGILKMIGGTGEVLDFRMIIDEMWTVAKEEMDFLIEANHIEEFQRLNSGIEYVTCPKVERKYTTSRILMMEHIQGIQIDKLEKLKEEGYDIKEICQKLAENYVKQILDDGFFHADPHPGNIWVREGKIVWLDLGMMGRLTNRDRQTFRKAMAAVVAGDVYELKKAVLTIGVVKGKVNHAQLYTDIDDMLTRYGTQDFGSINLGTLIQEVIELSKRNGIAMPNGVTMLARGVITIEGVLAACCPEINFIEIIATYVSQDYLKNLDLKKELRHFLRAFYNQQKKSIEIPARISDLLKMAIKGQVKVNLELIGSEEPLRYIDSMVDKLVVSIITAASLIGSSFLCTTQMKPQILGIPLLGFVGYLISVILGIWLIYNITKKK